MDSAMSPDASFTTKTGLPAKLLIGCGGVVLSAGLTVGALCCAWLYHAFSPNFMWGPGAYVFGIMQDIVYFAITCLLLGATMFLLGRYWLTQRR